MTRCRFARRTAALFLLLCVAFPLPGRGEPERAGEGASVAEGQDVGQYFDRFIRTAGPANYFDNASHPLRGLTTTDNSLLFGTVNCLRCHYSSATGAPRQSDECLKCHFEYQPNAPAPNHGNGKLEFALPQGNSLPKSAATVATLEEYDAWCLACHKDSPPAAGTPATTLGNVAARGRTAIGDNAYARSRHRSLPRRREGGPVGCIHCHAAHGSGNTRLVREYPQNRRTAGNGPARFGVFPNDNLGKGGYGEPKFAGYLSRVDKNVADADQDFRYCDTACHRARKDHRIQRDPTTGNYVVTPGKRMIHQVGEESYTIDNLADTPFIHVHVSQGIIPTDNMVKGFADIGGITGPSYYHYPGKEGSAPSSFGAAQNLVSPLPFFPDFRDGDRDFPNGWLDQGPIRYRYSCSTCHSPHGTALPNDTPAAIGFPDLRMGRKSPNELCRQCH